ncbi:MAG: hypothetical protein ACI81W_001612, partial [Saprospiraceae bacterium]
QIEFLKNQNSYSRFPKSLAWVLSGSPVCSSFVFVLKSNMQRLLGLDHFILCAIVGKIL